MTTRPWQPIAPLSPQTQVDFTRDDLLRQSIETGIIEGIYRLDEDQTCTLIRFGFSPAFIPQSGTGQDPDNLLAILKTT